MFGVIAQILKGGSAQVASALVVGMVSQASVQFVSSSNLSSQLKNLDRKVKSIKEEDMSIQPFVKLNSNGEAQFFEGEIEYQVFEDVLVPTVLSFNKELPQLKQKAQSQPWYQSWRHL